MFWLFCVFNATRIFELVRILEGGGVFVFGFIFSYTISTPDTEKSIKLYIDGAHQMHHGTQGNNSLRVLSKSVNIRETVDAQGIPRHNLMVLRKISVGEC